MPMRRIETLVCPRLFHEQASWSESPREPVVQRLQLIHDPRGPHTVHVSEGAATEGRKADTEHRPDVAVARRPEHAFLQAEHRLVHHREDAPLLNLPGVHLPAHATV